jgi:hypothetical protein
MVEHSAHHPKVVGSSSAASGREKVEKKVTKMFKDKKEVLNIDSLGPIL